jgi:hypothetical protein
VLKYRGGIYCVLVESVSGQDLSRFLRQMFSKKRILVITVALIIAIASMSTVVYFYFLPDGDIVNSLTSRKVLDTGSVLVQQFRDFQTDYFVINASEWYIKWKAWQPSIPEGTQLEIVVRDACTTDGQALFWIDMNQSHYLNIRGVFYMNVTVWPFNWNFMQIPYSFNVTIQVWQAEA